MAIATAVRNAGHMCDLRVALASGGVPLGTLAIRYHVGGSLDEAESDMLEETATIEEI